MTDDCASPSERRAFLQNVVSAGAAVASASLLSGCATTSANTNPNAQTAREAPQWDMSWQSKLGRYKTVYDAPEPQNGTPMYTVALTIAGYKAALPKTAGQFTPVLVLRHNASFTTLNDSMWKRVRAHTRLTPKDVADAYVNRNPFIEHVAGAAGGLVSATSSLAALVKEGTIILVCNRALGILARGLMGAEPGQFATVELALEEIWKNLVPGAYVMPNGLFAVAAAQDAGCGYVRIMPD
ncbi:MAG: hypothetical protein H7Z40_12335 [Phycisphaerae bacterium]|nr:hypothetical protein [Gemmatimonadaceae bacterium]